MHLECLLGADLEQCPTCQQPYHGECELGLALQQWARVRDDRPDHEEEWLAGAERLARGLVVAPGARTALIRRDARALATAAAYALGPDQREALLADVSAALHGTGYVGGLSPATIDSKPVVRRRMS